MKHDRPAPIPCLLYREACILKTAVIAEFGGAIWQSAPRQRRDRVDDSSKLVFRFLDLSQCFLQGSSSLTLLRNIYRCADEFDDIARRIEHRMPHNANPSV